jgi:hypothetical protein
MIVGQSLHFLPGPVLAFQNPIFVFCFVPKVVIKGSIWFCFTSVSVTVVFSGMGLLAPRPTPTWRTRVSLLVWNLTLDLSGLGDPTSSYATAGIGPEIIGTRKPHCHDKAETNMSHASPQTASMYSHLEYILDFGMSPTKVLYMHVSIHGGIGLLGLAIKNQLSGTSKQGRIKSLRGPRSVFTVGPQNTGKCGGCVGESLMLYYLRNAEMPL